MRALRVVLVALLVAGCDQTAFEPPAIGEDPPPGPGSPQWADDDLTCTTDDDCAAGEACDGGACRPKQCDDGPYESAVPLGPRKVFFREQELVVVDSEPSNGSFWIDGYDAAGTISYEGGGGGSFSLSASALADVARITTSDGAGVAALVAGGRTVTLAGRGFERRSIDVPFTPVAIAAGDVDGDSVDDIVAVSSGLRVAICSLAGSCTTYTLGEDLTAIDVAVGDTNGDGVGEVIALAHSGEQSIVAVWSPSVEDSEILVGTFNSVFGAVASGDYDTDGRAEVSLLQDGGWLGWASDKVHSYRVGADFTGIGATNVSSGAVDLATGDPQGGDAGDVLGVLAGREVALFRWNGSALAESSRGTVNATSAPIKLAFGDLDDDSVSAKLITGPTLVPGRLLPTTLIQFPPYDARLAGTSTSGVAIGNRTDISLDEAETITLQAGVEVGVEADFAGLFKAKLSTKLSSEIKRSRSLGRKWSVGTKFSLRPDPERYGSDYGAVVVACNCFHTYEYELIDSGNRAGGTGRKLTLIVPVGGQTTVLSTPRYRALAEQLGDLPDITVTRRIGDPSSYPTAPTKLDGSPVQPDEMVFPNRPTLRTSDVGTVAFSMSAGETETNSVAMSSSVSVQGSVVIGGVLVGGSLGVGWGNSYSVTVGEAAEFSGEVPPMPDDPNTPEDEYEQHAFSYSPYVYKQTYTDPVTNEPSGFYVLDYAVSRQ